MLVVKLKVKMMDNLNYKLEVKLGYGIESAPENMPMLKWI